MGFLRTISGWLHFTQRNFLICHKSTSADSFWDTHPSRSEGDTHEEEIVAVVNTFELPAYRQSLWCNRSEIIDIHPVAIGPFYLSTREPIQFMSFNCTPPVPEEPPAGNNWTLWPLNLCTSKSFNLDHCRCTTLSRQIDGNRFAHKSCKTSQHCYFKEVQWSIKELP